jgi:hypothetical protein
MQHNAQSSLTPEGIQLFMAGLAGLPEDEVRKAKSLFIRNEIARLKGARSSAAAFGSVQGCFSIIPIFWPMIRAQKRILNATLTTQAERIRNAIDVWRDDLGMEARDLERQLDELAPVEES